jgi:hypothetical protein
MVVASSEPNQTIKKSVSVDIQKTLFLKVFPGATQQE